MGQLVVECVLVGLKKLFLMFPAPWLVAHSGQPQPLFLHKHPANTIPASQGLLLPEVSAFAASLLLSFQRAPVHETYPGIRICFMYPGLSPNCVKCKSAEASLIYETWGIKVEAFHQYYLRILPNTLKPRRKTNDGQKPNNWQ